MLENKRPETVAVVRLARRFTPSPHGGERVGRAGYDESVSHRPSPLIPPSPRAKSDISDFATIHVQSRINPTLDGRRSETRSFLTISQLAHIIDQAHVRRHYAPAFRKAHPGLHLPADLARRR